MELDKSCFSDIPQCDSWKQITKIEKGWSSDKKYKILTSNGDKLLLRVSDISQYEQKKKEYEMIQIYSEAGFEMSFPKQFGICNQGKNVYMILSWVEGEDLGSVLLHLPEKEQYQLGRSAGTILRRIHNISIRKEDIPKGTKKEKKLFQLEQYEKCAVRIENDEQAIQYVKENIDKIWSLTPVYLHGDFHPGNLILTPSHEIGVIDFNRWEIGDPYEEFYKVESFGVEESIPYSIGQLDGYFSDNIPQSFWEILAVYVAHAALYSIKWGEKFGQKEIDGMKKRCRASFAHYDEFRQVVPNWYDASLKNSYL